METVLITGGAGFIGSNVANFFAGKGKKVIVFDNLSREKTDYNLQWLQRKYGNQITFIKGE